MIALFLTKPGMAVNNMKILSIRRGFVSSGSSLMSVRRNSTNKDSRLDEFFNQFYCILSDDQNLHSNSNVSQYQDAVIKLLHDNKKERFSEDELIELQTSIENLTTNYDDHKNIYQIAPDLIRILIKENEPSAKDFLKSCSLSSDDLSNLDYFDQYTLEAIMLYALGSLFHCIHDSPAVRVSTLVEQLDSLTKSHARLMKDRNLSLKPNRMKSNYANTDNKEQATDKKKQATDKKSKVYALGALLVEFLVERKMISLSNDLSFTEIYVSKKKKGKYYIKKNGFAICHFDISLLPIKFNLPMVCKPKNWVSTKESPNSLSDLTGGYLSQPVGDFYNYHRYSLLTSRDLNHFHIV